MRKYLILTLVLIMSLSRLYAQSDAQISQYWALPGYINPSALSLNDNLNVAALTRMQWTEISNSPTTFFITAEMPFKLFKKNQAAGIILINDKAGLFSNTSFALQYAYKMKMEEHNLSLGLRLGGSTQGFNGSKVEIPNTPDHNSSDAAIPSTDVSAMAFDLGFGAYYQYKGLHAGFSVAHLSAPEIELDEKSYIKLERTYYLTGGYNIELRNPLYELQTLFLVKTDMIFWQEEIDAILSYNKMFFGGLGYRFGDALKVYLGVEIKGVRLNYTYDVSTSAMARVSSGSHELSASYNIKLDLSGKSKNKHKSIRIL